MCRYFCTGFIEFILKSKSLLDDTNLFSPNQYEKNDKIISKYFRQLKTIKWKKSIALGVTNIENLKILKDYIFSIKQE